MIDLLRESFGYQTDKYFAVSNFIFFDDFGKSNSRNAKMMLPNDKYISFDRNNFSNMYDLWNYLNE